MKTKLTIKTLIIASILALICSQVKAQSFSEDFDDITTLNASGWSQANMSNPIGVNNWFQGNIVAFSAFNGAPDAYIGGNFNSTGSNGTIALWLFTPMVTLRNGDVFSFYTQKANPDLYADHLELRASTNGASTDVGTSELSIGDFTNLLVDINPTLVLGVYPTTWTQYTVTISGLTAPTTGRFAFRYFVTDAGLFGTNSDYIGIDNVVYTSYICPPISLSPSSIGNQTVGVAYSQTLTSTGTLGAATFAVTAGALPTGLSLSSTGDITGTPTATGTYSFDVTATDASGCSGVQTYTFDIVCGPNSATIPTYASQCDNGGLFTLSGGLPAGGTYSGAGVSGADFDPTAGTQTVTYTFTDGFGCVNTASSTITVNTAPAVIANTSVPGLLCSGDLVTLNGGGADTYVWDNTVTDGVAFAPPVGTTMYNVTGTDGNGCSNTASAMVTVNALPSVTASADNNTICQGGNVTLTGGGASTYTWDNSVTDGVAFTPAVGTITYNVTGTDGNGCFNTASTSVTVNAATSSYTIYSLCTGGSVTVGTSTYTSSGIYTDLLTNANGCDSTATTDLTILTSITSSQTYTLCAGQSVSVGTNTYSATGIYTDVLTAFGGCDSTVTTDLTVLNDITGSQTLTVCDGGSVTVGANTYTTTGIYTDVLTAFSGCDSTVTTDLTVLNAITGSQTLTVCDGGSLTVGANTYTTAGIYTDVLTAFSGCDSTVTTDLTVLNAITGSQTLTVCDGGSVTVGANTYTTTGIYTDVLTAFSGCDSTVTTDLTVLNAITGSQTLNLCAGQSVTVGANSYSATGIYTDVLAAFGGCDSTVTTDLTVASAITTTIDTLLCSNYGETLTVGASVYSTTGTYTDLFTSFSGCDSIVTSNVIATICGGIAEHSFSNSVNVYPNPSAGVFTLNITNADFKELVITIYDIQGRMVYSADDKNITKDYSRKINIADLSKGMYYLKLDNGAETKTEKLIIE